MQRTREHLESLTEEELDVIVNRFKLEEAAEINDNGKVAQMQYVASIWGLAPRKTVRKNSRRRSSRRR